jgi:hypothetical protein
MYCEIEVLDFRSLPSRMCAVSFQQDTTVSKGAVEFRNHNILLDISSLGSGISKKIQQNIIN